MVEVFDPISKCDYCLVQASLKLRNQFNKQKAYTRHIYGNMASLMITILDRNCQLQSGSVVLSMYIYMGYARPGLIHI